MADISKIRLPSDNTTYNLKDARFWYGTSSTTATTQTKVTTITNFTSDNLQNGVKVTVAFSTAQSYNGTPRLNVSSTGAKDIRYNTAEYAGLNAWKAGDIVTFTYNGSNWYIDKRDYLTLSDLPIYDGTVT